MSTTTRFAPSIRNQKGQSLVEYLIIVALVAVGTLSVMRVVGQSVQVKFAKVAESLGADVKGEIGKAEVTDSNWKKKDLRDFMQGTKKSDE
jgi:Flp pilus assembly pilin Flp